LENVAFNYRFDLMNNIQHAENRDNCPPCAIARTGEETYSGSLAVARFSPDDLAVTASRTW
jgi:hypothetical protein